MAAAQVLLGKPPGADALAYYGQLVGRLSCPIEVRLDAGEGRGKGLFATREIKEGEELFRERPLAGIQHMDNKLQVSACSHCFRPVGTVEQHIGGKICHMITELSEATEQDDLEDVQRRVDKIQAAVDSTYLEGLLTGIVQLPHSDLVQLPQPVPCPGGCGEEFCSEACARQAWDAYHCLLCTKGDAPAGEAGSSSQPSPQGQEEASTPSSRGKGKAPAEDAPPAGSSRHCHRSSARSGLLGSSGAASSSSGTSSRRHGSRAKQRHRQPPRQLVHGVAVDRQRLQEFHEHANETNEIFRLAAQLLAMTLVAADKLYQQRRQQEHKQEGQQQQESGSGGVEHSTPSEDSAAGTLQQEVQQGQEGHQQHSSQRQHDHQQEQEEGQALLRRAFLPFGLGHKVPWWEVVTLDELNDEDEECSEEELRAQTREMTADSLAILRAALQPPAYAEPLFTLELYGSLVGMFELNNLGLSIPSPIEAYFEMMQGQDAASQAAVALLKEALGDEIDTPCEGTGFFALQSCANHSCAPNAAVAGDLSGKTIVSAVRDVQAGEEITMCYIDEDAGLQQRQAALRGYGFVCACDRCLAEAMAQELSIG